jgi:hypothetical protein
VASDERCGDRKAFGEKGEMDVKEDIQEKWGRVGYQLSTLSLILTTRIQPPTTTNSGRDVQLKTKVDTSRLAGYHHVVCYNYVSWINFIASEVPTSKPRW